MTRNAWNLAPRTKAGRPEPDGRDLGVDFWFESTIDAWIARRRSTFAATRHETIVAALDTFPATPDGFAAVAATLGVHVRTVARHAALHEARDCWCHNPDRPGA